MLDGSKSALPNAAMPSPDAKTAKYLRSLMNKMRPDLEREIAQAEAAFASPTIPNNNGVEDALRGVSDLIHSNSEYVPYSAFSEMLHRENQLATLGGVSHSVSPYRRSSNKELATFNHIDENLERMLARVVRETENFALSPAQRILIAYWLEHLPVELHARVRAADGTERLASQVALPPNTRPALSIFNLPTGSGKTILGVLMAMSEVCDPETWQSLSSAWRERVWLSTAVGETGLASCVRLEDNVLARVVIAYVPAQLMNQWKRAAELANGALQKEKGYGFTIWTGTDPLQRQTEFQPRVAKTLTLAHKRSSATGVPILWIVAHTADNVTLTLRQSPSITFATKIYDECSHPQEPPRPAPEARAVSTIILQATIARLGNDRTSIVSKLALGGERFNQHNARHAAIFHMLSLPDWLAHMVSIDMTSVMPKGIQRVSLKVRVQSLSGKMLNSDLTITGVDDLLKTAMKSAGGEQNLNQEEYTHLLAKCIEILGANSTRDDAAADAAVVPSSATADGLSIHSRLLAAKANAEGEVAALPQPAPKPHRNAPEEEQREWWAGHDERERVRHKRLAFGATTRLFDALAKSIDPSNRAECPIGLDEIPPEHCGVLWCCSTCFDIRNRKYFKDKCPVCNQKFASCVLVATQAIAAIDPATTKPATSLAPAPAPLPCIQGDEVALRGEFASLSATNRTFSGSMKAVVAAMDAFLRYKPMGARILLAFPCEGDRAEHLSTRKTRETLKSSLVGHFHSIESIGASGSKTRRVVDEFVSDAPTNQIILINTNDRDHSRSLEGLDLWSTDLIVLATKEDAHLQSATFVQAIGRMMRPQFQTYVRNGWGSTGDDDDDDGVPRPQVGRPDKWLVLLEDAATVVDEEPEVLSDEEWEVWEDQEWANLVDVDPEQARALLGHD